MLRRKNKERVTNVSLQSQLALIKEYQRVAPATSGLQNSFYGR